MNEKPYVGQVVYNRDGRKCTVTQKDVDRFYAMIGQKTAFLAKTLRERGIVPEAIPDAIDSVASEEIGVDGLVERIQDNVFDDFNDGRLDKESARRLIL